MGMFSVTISVGSMEGDDFRRVDAVVDTGANYSQFPAPLLNELKVHRMLKNLSNLQMVVVRRIRLG